MVVAEVLDFPGVASQGFDLSDARVMIASALRDVAQLHLEEGKPLPVSNSKSTAVDADLIELLPLSSRRVCPGPEARELIDHLQTLWLPNGARG